MKREIKSQPNKFSEKRQYTVESNKKRCRFLILARGPNFRGGKLGNVNKEGLGGFFFS